MNSGKKERAEAVKALAAGRTEAVTPTVEPNSDDILKQVRADLDSADLGDFCRLRAAIGLVNFRELNAHGDWEKRVFEMFPNRAPRTIRRHMQNGRKFLAQVGVEAGDAYRKLVSMGADEVRGFIAAKAAGGKQLPERGVPKKLAAENRFTNAVVCFAAGERPGEAPAKPKRLTKEEEDLARREFALAVSRRVREWSGDVRPLRTLDTETLETIMSELTLSLNVVKGELREREANKVK